jgi:hypothetical protein
MYCAEKWLTIVGESGALESPVLNAVAVVRRGLTHIGTEG